MLDNINPLYIVATIAAIPGTISALVALLSVCESRKNRQVILAVKDAVQEDSTTLKNIEKHTNGMHEKLMVQERAKGHKEGVEEEQQNPTTP